MTLRFGVLVLTVACVSVIAAGEESGQMSPASGSVAPVAGRRGLTDVPGIKVGHVTLAARPTGCTVVLVDGDGAVGGVSVRGGAPGTRETDLLDPINLVEKVNAVTLAGGSAFGLDAASGVVRWLSERGIGYDTRVARVPIVPAAIIFDLSFGADPGIRPTADCGYQAASTATDAAVAEGNVGAGAGATIGKLGAILGERGQGGRRPMKGGVGTASVSLPNGLVVGAIVVVNAVGDIVDPATGRVVAGVLNPDGTLADVRRLLRAGELGTGLRAGENSTVGLVATNAALTKAQATRMAVMADDGLARAIVPAHTPYDGDTVFALATGRWTGQGQADVTLIGALAAEMLSEAVVRAATQATTSLGVAAAGDLADRR
jgi:L-aminopeptidase/D-esterase-like protein